MLLVAVFLVISSFAIAVRTPEIIGSSISEERIIAPLDAKVAGCKIVHILEDKAALKCRKNVAAQILKKQGFEKDEILQIMDLQADNQINADDVWNLGYTGNGVSIAVLDTGIDTDHPEFQTCTTIATCEEQIVCNTCEITNYTYDENGTAYPYNQTVTDCNLCGSTTQTICTNQTACTNTNDIAGGKGFGYATYEDDQGHGTHVAGIITANGVDANAKGVAPDTKVWMAKVCNSQGSCYTSDIAAAIEYVVKGADGIANNGDEPAKIISISLGGGGTASSNCDRDYLARKVNWAVDNGVTVIAAAGNSAGKVSSPGCASKAIAVGAVSKSDVRASWSGSGKALDIMAPGVSIYSSIIGSYASWSGTSMATPHISATVALLRQKKPNITNSEIKSALYKTAKDLGSTGWDRYYGYGRVDALGAINFVV